MIYVAQLTTANGENRNHQGRPSEKFLSKHPEFVSYYESGKHNEYIYRTNYAINSGKLVKLNDQEQHERELN